MKNKKLLLLTSLTILLTSCSQVNTGEVGIKTHFGAVDGGALTAGIYFYMPFVSSIQILNVKVQKVDDDSQAASKDLQNVQTKIVLNYHLGMQDPIAHFKRLGSDQNFIEDSIIKPATSETFKAIVAQFTAEELISKRDEVCAKIITLLSQKLKSYDLYIDNISITSFQFSIAYTQAIEAKQVAEQNASKAKNDLQRIQVEAQQKVVEATAQAQAMAVQKSIVTPELIKLKELEIQSKAIEKWDGRLPTYVSGSQIPLFINQK